MQEAEKELDTLAESELAALEAVAEAALDAAEVLPSAQPQSPACLGSKSMLKES